MATGWILGLFLFKPINSNELLLIYPGVREELHLSSTPQPQLKSEKTRAAAWSWNNFGSSERDGRKRNTIPGLVQYEYRGI